MRTKGDLISESILTLVPLPIKVAKSIPRAENLNKLFIVMDGKLKFSVQGSNLAPFVGNGTKIKIPSEIKPPLNVFDTCLLKGLTEVKDARIRKLMA